MDDESSDLPLTRKCTSVWSSQLEVWALMWPSWPLTGSPRHVAMVAKVAAENIIFAV